MPAHLQIYLAAIINEPLMALEGYNPWENGRVRNCEFKEWGRAHRLVTEKIIPMYFLRAYIRLQIISL